MRLRTRLLTCLALATVASAQSYEVTVIGGYPGAYLTYAKGLNDHGEVVGMAMFIPGGLKGFKWSEAQGFTLLPDPPGLSDFGAVDIDNAGVIAGDGGGDSGEVWRYTAGTYEMLGTLPGLPIVRARGLSASGGITGTSHGSSFYNPRHSFLAMPGLPMTSILDNSEAWGINNLDQVTGKAPSIVAYRYTPGSGVELLPPLGSRVFTTGYAINDQGHVVGVAKSTVEHSDVPFLYTDAGGMQEIGDFGGRANARDVNEKHEVVGNWEPSSGHWPWVWSPSGGVRFLNQEIDPALPIFIHHVYRINESGQILCHGRDQALGEWVELLLTPIDTCPSAQTYCGASQNPANAAEIGIDTCDSSASSIHLGLTGGPPGQFAYLLIGDGAATVSQPPGAVGDLCVAGGACLGRYAQDVGQIDALGAFHTDVQNALSDPCGGAVLLMPGVTWNFQYWHRQPGGAPATFSSAIAVTFQ